MAEPAATPAPAALPEPGTEVVRVKRSPWRDAWRRLNQDRLAMVSLVVVVLYALVGLATEIGLVGTDALPMQTELQYERADWGHAWAHFGWFGQTLLTFTLLVGPLLAGCYIKWGWNGPMLRRFGIAAAVLLIGAGIFQGVAGPEPCGATEEVIVQGGRTMTVETHTHSFTRHLFGADTFGRNIFSRAMHGSAIAFKIGVFVTLMAVPIGVFLGLIAGYFGGLVDELVVWLYTTLASIPGLLLILAISFALKQVQGIPDIWIVYVALGTVTWITLCRLIRGEVMKHKNRDYVVAAQALGGGHIRSMVRHILPNVFHLVIIRFSLQFVFAIETEVILSYLGVGLSDPSLASWGRMINDAKQELIRGEFGNITGATLALFGLALAFNLLGDGLRDALDPKLNQ